MEARLQPWMIRTLAFVRKDVREIIRQPPVLLGEGTRLFDLPGSTVQPTEFEGPTLVVQGTGVTHLRYRVIK